MEQSVIARVIELNTILRGLHRVQVLAVSMFGSNSFGSIGLA